MGAAGEHVYELARAIAHTAWLLRRHVAGRLAQKDSEWRLLAVLAEGAAVTRGEKPAQAELSAMLGLSASAFTRLVDRAAARGLVRRVAGRSRRAHAVRLTRKGRAAWRSIRRRIHVILPEVFDGVDGGQARAALAVLQRVSRTLQGCKERR